MLSSTLVWESTSLVHRLELDVHSLQFTALLPFDEGSPYFPVYHKLELISEVLLRAPTT